MTVTTDCPKRCPATDISVLIVGAGVAGLMAALECWRNGHEVRIIERSPEQVTTGESLSHRMPPPKQSISNHPPGDSFTIGPSAIRALNHWPKMVEENEKIAHNPTISFHSVNGTRATAPKHIDYTQGQDSKNVPERVHRHWRPQYHDMLSKQLSTVGINVEYGHKAVEYFEDGPTGRGGIVLENGDRIDADVIVAADGIGSRSTRATMGREIQARPSGEAMYRTAFPVEIAMADPVVRERFPVVEGNEGPIELWIG